MQEPMGEDVAALTIGAELDLVDGEEGEVALERHRLDRGQDIRAFSGPTCSSPVESATAPSPTRPTTRS
jgi:hypothetical protein